MPRGRRTAAQMERVKRLFLDSFKELGVVSGACRVSGVNRKSIYHWLEHDAAFLAEFHDAELNATEVLELEARRRAVEGVQSRRKTYDRRGELIDEQIETKYSDQLLMFLLKSRSAKYRDQKVVELSGPGGLPIQYEDVAKMDDAELDELIADLARRQALTGAGATGTAEAAAVMETVTGPAD